MTITTATAAPARRATTPQPAAPPPQQEAGDSVDVGNNAPKEKKIAWGNLAFLGAATVAGAGAGVYAGLNPGPVAEIISWGLVPGAAIGGAVLGGVLGEKLEPKFLGEYPAIGGALWGGLGGAAIGVTQMLLAGSHASPWLAASMGVTGAMAGVAGSVALLLKAKQ